ncbi:helix-turn-helix domain-containing protein [Sandarakinorhabdus rubra]|uniref:helix-turn-helix domain-containing protein n=1 Tax=Sandarakinorhabdus rubra TaxID=2672568 RepID=UPI0013DA5EA6|nr:helix-turn-helix domain-containing protein [Sandarakinorhabdus rubra]
MSNPAAEDRRARVVAAAIGAFAAHGYRRCTMADIAAAAGMSRPALYLMFCGKEAVFRAVAEALLADAAIAAERAWPAGTDPAQGLAAAILAKDLPIQRLCNASPHADEILAVAGSLTADLHQASTARFVALLARRLGEAGLADADALARMLANAAAGLKHAGLAEAEYVADVQRLAGLIRAK